MKIRGIVENDLLMYDRFVFSDYFGWHILSGYDMNAGIMSVEKNGSFYKDISAPLDAALVSIAKEAEANANSFKKFGWFYDQVNHHAAWDIKRETSWNKTIAEGTFPGVGEQVYYNGQLITPEQLGNYAYGYIGAALGLSLSVLYTGSWAAAGFPVGGDQLKDEAENDRPMIEQGYEAYKS